ncbi:TetR/AcrR family transcriptional regulator [Rhodococcus fascians]|nr:TetR/AcrR family transcriptional regulator [Rhodococcus fascians]MBY4114685.1 TetR/AcrR family transcriptional regulator [Rhodococcus fascians]
MPRPELVPRRIRPLTGGLDRVCEAGAGLFAKRGYSGTNMKDLGVELGVQAPSLYNYVDSKQQILDEIVLRYFSSLREALLDGLSLSADSVERARRAIEEQSRFKLGNIDAMIVSERDRIHLSEPVGRRVSEYYDEFHDLWSDIVTQGVADGRFSTPHVDVAIEILVDLAGPRQIHALTQQNRVAEARLAYWFGETAVQLLTS